MTPRFAIAPAVFAALAGGRGGEQAVRNLHRAKLNENLHLLRHLLRTHTGDGVANAFGVLRDAQLRSPEVALATAARRPGTPRVGDRADRAPARAASGRAREPSPRRGAHPAGRRFVDHIAQAVNELWSEILPVWPVLRSRIALSAGRLSSSVRNRSTRVVIPD